MLLSTLTKGLSTKNKTSIFLNGLKKKEILLYVYGTVYNAPSLLRRVGIGATSRGGGKQQHITEKPINHIHIHYYYLKQKTNIVGIDVLVLFKKKQVKNYSKPTCTLNIWFTCFVGRDGRRNCEDDDVRKTNVTLSFFVITYQ